jgi:Uma2 family endonuclease
MNTSYPTQGPMWDKAAEQLVLSPRLPFYVKRFHSLLKEETEKRQRFYEEMSEEQKVEFICGELVVHSPVKKKHNQASARLFHLLDLYVVSNNLGFVGHERILITLTRNDYEPDVCYFGPTKSQGFTPDQSKFPAPDFIAEILSDSTEEIDRGIKFDDYAAHGVVEYWIIDSEQESIEQYGLSGDHYDLVVKALRGPIESIAVRGFQIPVRAVFERTEHLEAVRRIV